MRVLGEQCSKSQPANTNPHSLFHFHSSSLLDVLGMRQKMAQVFGLLLPKWEIGMECLASGFGLTQL